MKPQLFSGARGMIQYKDPSGNVSTLAFVTDVSISSNDGLRPVYVIGNMNPNSIEPISVDASDSVGRIIPINDAKGAALKQFDAIDFNIEPIINQIETLDTVEITIFDQNLAADPSGKTPKVLGSLKYARYAGKSMNSAATDLATERYNFVGIWDGGYDNSNGGGAINYGLGSDKA